MRSARSFPSKLVGGLEANCLGECIAVLVGAGLLVLLACDTRWRKDL